MNDNSDQNGLTNVFIKFREMTNYYRTIRIVYRSICHSYLLKMK